MKRYIITLICLNLTCTYLISQNGWNSQNSSRPDDEMYSQNNGYQNNPYNDPNYYPNDPYAQQNWESQAMYGNHGGNWQGRGGSCANTTVVINRPVYQRRPPVVVLPPSYCAPVVINPYAYPPPIVVRPYAPRYYGHGFRSRGNWRWRR